MTKSNNYHSEARFRLLVPGSGTPKTTNGQKNGSAEEIFLSDILQCGTSLRVYDQFQKIKVSANIPYVLW